MSNGIEIHFDEKRGYLELACEPDAFAPFREVARTQLADFPEISLDKVIELNIIDTATFVARRDAPRRNVWDWLIGGVVVLIVIFAVIGVVAVVRRLVT